MLGYTDVVYVFSRVHKPVDCVYIDFNSVVLPGQNSYNVPGIGVDDVINIQLLVISIAFQVQDVSQAPCSKRASGFNGRWKAKIWN